jgi:hypothetical protein
VSTKLPDGFERAYLDIEDGQKLWCWFNPKDYTVSRSNKWTVKPKRDPKGKFEAQFTGSDPHKLAIDLLFDGSDKDGDDVRDVCTNLLDMMEMKDKLASADKNAARPPTVEFGWGGVLTFKAVVEQLSIQYTLFKPNGVPIRALVKLQMTQVDEAPPLKKKNPGKKQNPTTTGFAGLGSHVVRDGDSLPSISYRVYGDATQWRVIAEANAIDDPLALRRGTVLSIPAVAE